MSKRTPKAQVITPFPLRVGVAGLGRMGIVHALHIYELSRETSLCVLTAVATMDRSRAQLFFEITGVQVPVFETIEELAESGLCEVTVIATNTELHRSHTLQMIGRGQRVFLEKPLTGSVEGDRAFAAELESTAPEALMIGFQRRFDAPLLYAKELIASGQIGRIFKVCSALEDSSPAPNGFSSPGILPDMGIHNVDEILWLTGLTPRAAMMIGSQVFSHRHTTCAEDFDDALMLVDFGDELIGQIQVSRNHVSGYRVETTIYGESGHIQIGRFAQCPAEVTVECYGKQEAGTTPSKRVFQMRTYEHPLPEFIHRFGDAYKAELRVFLECCLHGEKFPTNHHDALRAQEVVAGGMKTIIRMSDIPAIEYGKPSSYGKPHQKGE